MMIPPVVILSRPDALGDAVVTLTTAGWIKHLSPHTRIFVLCRAYSRAIWANSRHVDGILTLEELQGSDAIGRIAALKADAIVHVFPHRDVARWAKQARVPLRIGTSHRWWHWLTCNERVHFSRKRSDLHEAQLNIKLLAPFAVEVPDDVQDLVPHIGFVPSTPSPKVTACLRMDRRRLVLHPLLGSGVGWGLANYASLIEALDPDRWQVLVTGTAPEKEVYAAALPLELPHVTDVGGQLDLTELIMLIGSCDAMVAASTGPLHIAAAVGVRTIGLFSMKRPIFPTRWHPLGRDAHALVFDANCSECASGAPCDCITRIPVQRVLDLLEGFL